MQGTMVGTGGSENRDRCGPVSPRIYCPSRAVASNTFIHKPD
jgi:hypothetical protein